MPELDLGLLRDMPEGQPTLRRAGDRRFACIRLGGTVDVLDDVCPHQGYPLSQGTLRDGVLTCQWHNWKFETATGACTFGGEDVRRFAARIEGGHVIVDGGVDVAAEARRLGNGIRAALLDNDPGRAVRDGLRLGACVPHPLGVAGAALGVVAADAAVRARYGFDHALALLADLCSWVERGWLDGADALAVAATAAGEEHQARPPRPRPADAAGDGIVGHLVHERRAEAEAGVRALARALGAEAAVSALRPFVALHLYDYGHGAIFLAKAQELSRRYPDAAEDVMASEAVALGWATADTALPPFASTRAALERLGELHLREAAGAGFDRAAFEGEVLAGERRAVEACVARLSDGCAPGALLVAIAHAAATRVLRLDSAWESRLDAEVGVLDVTHAVTFAEAALSLGPPGADPGPARRLAVLAAGFVGKLRTADGPEPEVGTARGSLAEAARARDVTLALGVAQSMDGRSRHEAYRELAPFAALEARIRPIHVAHAVKMTEALSRLEAADPEADGVWLKALVSFMVPRRPERNVKRVATVARQFLLDERPPVTLY